MIKLEWNALRPGHDVLVHDTSKSGECPLRRGVVELVDVLRPFNRVGIRLEPIRSSDTAVTWPAAFQVHLGSYDPGEACPLCIPPTP